MRVASTIRSRALNKLASLSVADSSSIGISADSDLSRLCEACPQPQSALNGASNGLASEPPVTGRIPMSFRELEVLLALCEAAPSIPHLSNADRLLHQIAPYVSECCYQAISPSPFLRGLTPSPWESLSSRLIGAVLQIGLCHASLRAKVMKILSTYTENCSGIASFFAMPLNREADDLSVDHGRLLGVSTLTTSLLGFFEAATANAHFWKPHERYEIIQDYQSILSDGYLTATESTFSTIRNSSSGNEEIGEWKQYVRRYAGAGRPLGAMLLRQGWMKMVKSFASLLVLAQADVHGQDVLAVLMSKRKTRQEILSEGDDLLLESLATVASQEIIHLEEGSDYLQLGSAWQQRMAHSVKASSLSTFLCCVMSNEEYADPDILMTWLEATLADSTQVADVTLASVVLQCMAIMAPTSPAIASNISRIIARFLVRGPLPAETASVASNCLLSSLKVLPQDTVITTLYGLGNSLSAGNSSEAPANYALFNDVTVQNNHQSGINGHHGAHDSSLNLQISKSGQDSSIHKTVISAIVTVARGFNDETITALALSMLIQKVGKLSLAVDVNIITEAVMLAVVGGEAGFANTLKLYTRLSQQSPDHNDSAMIHAVAGAREYLSRNLKGGTVFYEIYLQHLLETIISKGEVRQRDSTHRTDVDTAAHDIAVLLRPLALLVANNVDTASITDVESFPSLQRDAWYNIVVHGFSIKSPLGKQFRRELQVLAQYGHSLIAEESADRNESDVELNTVLRRGSSAQNVANQRKELIEMIPQCEGEIKSLSYPELIFLKAAHLVETLRASSGDCTKILTYFVDPQLRGNALNNCMVVVAIRGVDSYLASTLTGSNELFSAPYVAQQLVSVFESCCHRVAAVQKVAYACAERIISQVPSALCQRKSLFALLDLLTIMWLSCLEEETEEYQWRSSYSSTQGTTNLQLSDDYSFRRSTLRSFHKHAREWIGSAINKAPLDVKGFLQTYLSDYGDDEAFGHMSLGRSFAFEMGAMIPKSDQRLGAIEVEEYLNINTASDFMAQYTTRQEYRYTDNTHIDGDGSFTCQVPHEPAYSSVIKSLADLDHRLVKRESIPVSELRETLRQAATLLCRSSSDHNTVLAYFVRIPFLVFSKQAIKVGLSLWIGVIKENPRMESRVLIEIIECWITTVRTKRGIFSKKMRHLDPFYIKEEFAPSDRDASLKQQQRAHDLIVPHYRVLQFLSSHYTATRLSNFSVEKAYHRFLKITLRGLRNTASHPLAREVHFHILLLGLGVLRYNTSLSSVVHWRLKDDLLSAGLAWFAHPPRWSFGGNRLQVKAETQLLADVSAALQALTGLGSRVSASLRSLQQKQELLDMLLKNEVTRLTVWLYPLDHERRHHFTSSYHGVTVSEDSICSLLPVAWDENPAIAIHLVSRCQSEAVADGVRWFLLQYPESVISEPDALQIFLGYELPNDVSFQLKYLMYWAPVNPITAVTLFLPAYGNHPCIVQYAVRALESHSVDVTFFYVPQIVQTLRYDALGYVQAYIIETAKFSQLFAHQIIWNMKANAFKDEESEIPDPVKPVLDKVTDSLILSFSKHDRDFYEREFAFFNEVTGISGKLRPFIKKSKPEKKQKIEEELRKIQVEVGVYLPSNPDGVVIGIDRKSGKPLQSHAKAPYMATFRIQKEKRNDMEATEEQLGEVNATGSTQQSNTYEVWQSAIFKVGDDCRQDVLALQMIAAFRGIFHYVGLPVYVFPYRVTATAPGCGVIDVLPNSISRDMLGREAVNGLYEWFVSKFGGEDAPAFQVARANFVKSLAAYSVISFLLQFKDRHNGNIMFDDQGHILHIDFGFCFDIAPGGVRFERAPFKLTKEMVSVMGGGTETQSFRWFEELCVKAFLAARPFVATLSSLVVTMLDSGLPCFKPETVQHFRDRFVMEMTEREAADFMRGLVHKSYRSYSTKGYDQFQLMTNGIPY